MKIDRESLFGFIEEYRPEKILISKEDWEILKYELVGLPGPACHPIDGLYWRIGQTSVYPVPPILHHGTLDLTGDEPRMG